MQRGNSLILRRMYYRREACCTIECTRKIVVRTGADRSVHLTNFIFGAVKCIFLRPCCTCYLRSLCEFPDLAEGTRQNREKRCIFTSDLRRSGLPRCIRFASVRDDLDEVRARSSADFFEGKIGFIVIFAGGKWQEYSEICKMRKMWSFFEPKIRKMLTLY